MDVLAQEAVVQLVMRQCSMAYEKANQMCKQTEAKTNSEAFEKFNRLSM